MASIRQKITERLKYYGEPERVECIVEDIMSIVKEYKKDENCSCDPQQHAGWFTIRICKTCFKVKVRNVQNNFELRGKLRQLRMLKGIPLYKAAWAIGLAPATLCNWELCKRPMSKFFIDKYESFLKDAPDLKIIKI